MYPRILANVLESSQRSVLVLGPRQVGKSTLLASTAPDVSLNLASPRVFREFVGHPERLERELLAAPADAHGVSGRGSASPGPARRGADPSGRASGPLSLSPLRLQRPQAEAGTGQPATGEDPRPPDAPATRVRAGGGFRPGSRAGAWDAAGHLRGTRRWAARNGPAKLCGHVPARGGAGRGAGAEPGGLLASPRPAGGFFGPDPQHPGTVQAGRTRVRDHPPLRRGSGRAR